MQRRGGLPLQRSAEIDCLRRLLAHLRDGTTDLAPEPMRLPASVYTSPERCSRERRELFRRRPIVADGRRSGHDATVLDRD